MNNANDKEMQEYLQAREKARTNTEKMDLDAALEATVVIIQTQRRTIKAGSLADEALSILHASAIKHNDTEALERVDVLLAQIKKVHGGYEDL